MQNIVTALTYRRQRAEALAAGPEDQAVQAALDELMADDTEVADVFGWLDQVEYTQLDRLRGAAIRGGAAEALAYVAEERRLAEAYLQPKAERIAADRQEANWNDAGEALAEGRAA